MALESKDGHEWTLSRLIVEVTQDIRTMVRKELELARTELTGSLQLARKGVPLLVVAGVLSLYGLGMLFTAGAWGLRALGVSDWLAFLIIAVVLFLIATVLALVGKRSMDKIQPRPERTIASVEETVAQLKQVRQAGDH
jgi:hypothetical protein